MIFSSFLYEIFRAINHISALPLLRVIRILSVDCRLVHSYCCIWLLETLWRLFKVLVVPGLCSALRDVIVAIEFGLLLGESSVLLALEVLRLEWFSLVGIITCIAGSVWILLLILIIRRLVPVVSVLLLVSKVFLFLSKLLHFLIVYPTDILHKF